MLCHFTQEILASAMPEKLVKSTVTSGMHTSVCTELTQLPLSEPAGHTAVEVALEALNDGKPAVTFKQFLRFTSVLVLAWHVTNPHSNEVVSKRKVPELQGRMPSTLLAIVKATRDPGTASPRWFR